MTTYEKIEILRKGKQMSQRKLEETLGFSNGSISKWKKSAPSPDRLQKIAAYFDVSVDYLLDESRENPNDFSSADSVAEFHAERNPELFSLYERLDVEDRARVLDFICGLLMSTKYAVKSKEA